MLERIKIQKVDVLSDDWYVLKKTTFDYLRNDGTWQRQSRETYDRGNGATILLYNMLQETVILVKQFRFPTYVNGLQDGLLLETAAGLLDDASPEERIKREAEEETGYQVTQVTKVFEAHMSPGSVTEKLYFFVAEYQAKQQGKGGGIAEEGEDIEVLELPFAQSMQMIADGTIQDAKTIMLLQYAALHIFHKG